MNTRETQRVTRRDVAALAGTSVAVVSYVVNNGPRPVASATRDRVLAAIEATGYHPDGIARALAAGSTKTYGLVVPDISNPFFAAVAHAIEDEMFSRGRVLLLGDSAESREREHEIVSNLLQRRVDGLLYIGVHHHPRVHEIVPSGTPVVVLDRIDETSPAASVVVDNVGGARAAVEHLIHHGYRRIACISGPEEHLVAQDRRTGWESALTAAGMSASPALVHSAPFSRAGGLDAGRRLLAQPVLPRAVLVSSDQQAIGLVSALAEAGVRVPEDLAVFSFDGTEDSAYCVPPLSTVRQPVEEMARHAIGLLTEPDRYESRRVVCAYELVLRRSCGCPPVAAGPPGDHDSSNLPTPDERSVR